LKFEDRKLKMKTEIEDTLVCLGQFAEMNPSMKFVCPHCTLFDFLISLKITPPADNRPPYTAVH